MHRSDDIADPGRPRVRVLARARVRDRVSLPRVAVQRDRRAGQDGECVVHLPAARDGGQFEEYGGAYSLYRAMAFGPDGGSKLPDVSCVP